MNAAHWHLAMNHIPVVGVGFAAGLLAFALWKKRAELFGVCLGAFAILAALTVPVYLTGDPAESAIMEMPGVDVDEALVHPHESAALFAFIGIGVVGAVALGGLIVGRKMPAPPRAIVLAVFTLSLVEAGVLARTAYLGGHIRHSEIRPAGPAAVPAAKSGGERKSVLTSRGRSRPFVARDHGKFNATHSRPL